ncbi:hypothetical protein [Moorena producens]|uniref:hypothetical protein n=1 Tax=Moorena producens TaxID=1155739 RepID=UPI0013145E8B|nr:hypothetical protein [Moorena producens]
MMRSQSGSEGTSRSGSPESKSGASSKSCLTQQWCVTGQQPNSGYGAKHEGPPNAPYTTPDSRLPTPDSRLPTPYSLLPFLKPEPKPLITEFFAKILELKSLSQ